MSLRLIAAFAFFSTLLQSPGRCTGQQPAASAPTPEAQVSPHAAYEDALHPLEITRRNIANWSDTEIAAMKVAIARGKAECAARQPGMFAGADLLEYARLCSLGQQWPAVATAAGRYIDEPGTPKPRLAEAHVDKVDADLRMKAEGAALADAITALRAVPYTPDVADAIDETLDYMRFVHTADALTLAGTRQPLLLSALRNVAVPAPAGTSNASDANGVNNSGNSNFSNGANGSSLAATPSVPLPQLYAEGVAFAALQQLSGGATAAKATMAALEAALPATIGLDQAVPIAGERRRYVLLGQPLGDVHPLASLSAPRETLPTLPARGAATALLLFPDWCAVCVHMGPHLPETVIAVEGHSAYIYALLAETVPPRKLDPTMTNFAYDPAFASTLLAETPTVTVPPDTLDRFVARDFPFLILTDASGIVRVLQPVGAEDLLPGGSVDAAIALVGRNFPLPHPAAAAKAPSAPPKP